MANWFRCSQGRVCWLSTSLGLLLLWPMLTPSVTYQAVEPRTVNYRLQDNVPMDMVIGNVGEDAEIFQGPNARYSVTFQLYSSLFWIHAQDGILKTRSAIDRDVLCPEKANCKREVNVQVRQNSGTVSFVKVVLAFDDENDNSPRFGQTEVHVSLSEGSSPGTRVLMPKATDPDSLRYGVQKYALENAPSNIFSLEQINDTGSIDVYLVLLSMLDRESVDHYRFQLVAFDGGQPSKSGVALILIEVTDVNDNIPVFDRDTYEVWVLEDTQPGTVITRVNAIDQDAGSNGQIFYELDLVSPENSQNLFRVDPITGDVITQDLLDFETQPVHTLNVLARDGVGPEAVPGRVRVVVRLKNCNDNPPEVRIQTSQNLDESEGLRLSELSSPGEFVSLVTVADRDGENTTIVCSVNDEHFRLEQLFKNEYKIVTAADIDRETHAQLALAILCEDDGLPPLTGSGNVTIIIEDINDNQPIFLQDSYTVEVSEDFLVGQTLLVVSASDRDVGPNAEVRYSVDSGEGFSIDARTGVIFATRPLDREREQVVNLVLAATDMGNPPLSSSATISLLITDVDDEIPKFSKGSYTFTVPENQPANSIVGQVQAVDADLPPFNTVHYLLQPDFAESFRVDSEDGVIYTMSELDREFKDMEQFQVFACNHFVVLADLASNCSSAQVTVIVLDINDNDPSVLYPLPSDTIFVGNRFTPGDPVAQIRASDIDSGSGNAGRLHFRLVNQTTNDYFRVDENSGEILAERDLTVISHATFALQVEVSDRGSPPRVTVAVINLTVNETLSTVTEGRLTMMSGRNLTIVIAISSASGLIVVLLLTAIACLMRTLSTRKATQHTTKSRDTKSYLMRPDPSAGDSVSMMSTLRLNTDGGLNPIPYPSSRKSRAVFYDKSLNHATIGGEQAFKWYSGDETEEHGEKDDERLGSGRHVKHLMKRRMSLTAPETSDSGRGSSEEVTTKTLPEVKLTCQMLFDQPFLDLSQNTTIYAKTVGREPHGNSPTTESSDKSGYTSFRKPQPLQLPTDKISQELTDANSVREFHQLGRTPCHGNSNNLHCTKIPSVNSRLSPKPLSNTKDDGSGRTIRKSWLDEDRCCRSHPELLVDCNIFSSDNGGSFV